MSDDVKKQVKTEGKVQKKKSWIVPTATTLIGVFVSLAIAWYQINLSEEQALQAEKERAKAVKNELTLIVEEHVINQKMLDISRLARLSELRSKQEKLLLVPTVSEIVETAEYNILRSQYLDFEKKEQYKNIFDGIYSKMYVSPVSEYTGLFEHSVNELYSSIQQGTTKESLEKLNKLLTDFNNQITELEKTKQESSKSIFVEVSRVLIDKPHFFIMTMITYLMAMYLLMYVIRRKRRRYAIFDDDFDKDFYSELYDRELKEKFKNHFRAPTE